MLEKYGTYRVFKNIKTGEVKRVKVSTDETPTLKKYASKKSDWEELDYDPRSNKD